MFTTYYYDPEMSKMNFEYQLVSFEESLGEVADSLKKQYRDEADCGYGEETADNR